MYVREDKKKKKIYKKQQQHFMFVSWARIYFYILAQISLAKNTIWFLFVLRFYGPVNPMGSCRARSVYLTTRLLGRHSPLSG